MDLESASRALGLDLNPEQVGCLLRYRDLVVTWTRRLDLVAPAPPEEVLRSHVLDSLLLLGVASPPPSAWVADVGSGAGLPGLVWAVARPDLHVVLLEPRRKRAAFLERAVGELAVRNVQVEVLRSEQASLDPRYRGRFDVVVARAVAPPEQVRRMAGDLVKPGGKLVVPVGPQARVREPFREIAREVPWQAGRVRRVAVLLV